MEFAEINLLEISRGAITAPAGCGKTQLIASALANHQGSKPVLVLTHTNAGVAALRDRLNRAGIPSNRYRLSTIDGWAIRLISTFPGRSNHAPDVLQLANPSRDYPDIRSAAYALLQTGHVNNVIRSSYAHLIVDEYQDCSVAQHQIVCLLSLVVPTCILGDPMQAIFGFRGNQLANWNQQVCTHFPVVAELRTPWRWRNAGAEALGEWLLDARRRLASGEPIDLRTGPAEHITWIQVAPPNDHIQRLAAARIPLPTDNAKVLIIADSRNRAAQQNIASQTPGASTVEAVDLRDLITFCTELNINAPDAIDKILMFAAGVMTNVGATELKRRLGSLARNTARTPPNEAENAALEFMNMPSYSAAARLLTKIHAQPNVRVHRPTILYGVIKSLREASTRGIPLPEAAQRVREDNRLQGRALPKRAVGSTLLLKGLEAEVAVLLHTDDMNPQHLYVAMTRGSMRLIVCSASPVIG